MIDLLLKQGKKKILSKKFPLIGFVVSILTTLILATGSLPVLSQSSFEESSPQTILNQNIWRDLQLLFQASVGQSLETKYQ